MTPPLTALVEAREVIANALFYYRESDHPRDKSAPPWGRERTEWRADAVLKALADAGLTVSIAALSAFEAEPQRWRTMETAPTDGSLFLVWAPGREGLSPMYSLCAYHPDAGFCIDELREPTHWQPLPLPPETPHE